MMPKMRKRSSLQLLIDNERLGGDGGGHFGSSSSCGGDQSASAARNGFYISDDDEDDEEGVFRKDPHKRRRARRGCFVGVGGGGCGGDHDSGPRWHRRDSYGNPVSFKRVAFYEEAGILMIIQSIGAPEQQQQQKQQGGRSKAGRQGLLKMAFPLILLVCGFKIFQFS